MIATKNKMVPRKSDAFGDLLDEAAETGRRHAGIAAFMIDLVAGCLDQHGHRFGKAAQECGLDHHRVSRADGGDAARHRDLAFAKQKLQRTLAVHLDCRVHDSVTTLVR